MNKSELISTISDKINVEERDVKEVIDSFLEVVEEVIESGDKLTLVGFGTFETVNRKARTGKNPQTGRTIEIPAATVPKFKPGSKLKAAANK